MGFFGKLGAAFGGMAGGMSGGGGQKTGGSVLGGGLMKSKQPQQTDGGAMTKPQPFGQAIGKAFGRRGPNRPMTGSR